MTNLKYYISTVPMATTTKVTSVVKYNEKFPLIKSNDYLITWSCEASRVIKFVIYSFPPNMAK